MAERPLVSLTGTEEEVMVAEEVRHCLEYCSSYHHDSASCNLAPVMAAQSVDCHTVATLPSAELAAATAAERH